MMNAGNGDHPKTSIGWRTRLRQPAKTLKTPAKQERSKNQMRHTCRMTLEDVAGLPYRTVNDKNERPSQCGNT
jgi:hypothetical protein